MRHKVVFLILFCAWGAMCFAGDFSATRATMARYLDAQTRWQTNLAELIIKQKPEFESIASVQREHQLALIALKGARFAYLVEHEPGRLGAGELGRFSNFTWSDADTKAASSDPGYRVLEENVQRTRAVNDGQPGWDAFRDYFRTEFSRSEEYQKELATFLDELETIKQQAGLQ